MLRVVCLLALAVAAHARPDAPAQVNAWDADNNFYALFTRGIQDDVCLLRAEPTVPATEPVTVPATEAVTVPATEAVTEAATTSEPAPPPVHQRFPHAVLFGGTCGGTIISARWVLTAAHCTLFTSGRSILAGTSNSESGSGVSVRIKKLHVHPRFSVGPYWLNAKRFNFKQIGARWDFMLAELASPLPLDGVNMAAALLDGAPLPADAPVAYAGYGAEQHGGLMRPDMHAMALRTLTDLRCGELEQYDAQDMLCAEGRTDTRDSACNGDSGSGLVTDDGGPRRLLGVTSWVENDAHECRPGARVVFSRVAAARPWIKQLTGV